MVVVGKVAVVATTVGEKTKPVTLEIKERVREPIVDFKD